MAKVYFSTGSNQGDRLTMLVQAAKLINKLIGKVILFSPVVESEPWGFEAETNFFNQVLMIETQQRPEQVLNQILEIETKLGRIRSGKGYSSRNIDIDILFYDEKQVNESNLEVPHPLLHKRKFILQPLADIAPDLIHPVLQTTIIKLLSQLNDDSKITIAVNKEEFTRLFIQ
jgi:2-amino-4-hydroxy-6-hydroxymethyldihydropteridine diphosphokinase